MHQVFLEQLRRRLEQWDLQQKVGDVFLDVVSNILFINYFKTYFIQVITVDLNHYVVVIQFTHVNRQSNLCMANIFFYKM